LRASAIEIGIFEKRPHLSHSPRFETWKSIPLEPIVRFWESRRLYGRGTLVSLIGPVLL
jgi:hypothetical protein